MCSSPFPSADLLRVIANAPDAGQAVSTHVEVLQIGGVVRESVCVVTPASHVPGICWEIEVGEGGHSPALLGGLLSLLSLLRLLTALTKGVGVG